VKVGRKKEEEGGEAWASLGRIVMHAIGLPHLLPRYNINYFVEQLFHAPVSLEKSMRCSIIQTSMSKSCHPRRIAFDNKLQVICMGFTMTVSGKNATNNASGAFRYANMTCIQYTRMRKVPEKIF